MSAPISGRATSSTPSWWWCSVASAISGARWSVHSRSASPTSSWSRWRGRCSARSPFWCSSFCLSRSDRAACSRSRAERWKHDAACADALAVPQRDRLPARGGRLRRADSAVEPAAAGWLGISGADLSGGAVRQICLLRDPGAVDRFDLGLLRDPLARPWRVLRARWLRDGHLSDASDRQSRRLRQSDPARFHGFPELSETSLVLARLRYVLVRRADRRCGAGPVGLLLRLVGVPLARHRRLSVDHHASDDLCVAAGLLPQRFRVRRQQRADRFQGYPWLQRAG